MKLAAAHIAAVLALAGLAAPSAAHAKAAVLKGEVAGQAWRVGTKTVVPVLLSARSAKRAKLRSPVGVLVLSARSVRTPAGAIRPLLLRPADRVKTRAKVRAGDRRASYWRIGARSLTVTKRSPTRSAAELEALVSRLRADLAALSKALTWLATYTQNGFVKHSADIEALRREITALKAQVAALAAEIRRMGGTLPTGTIPLGPGGTPSVDELVKSVETVEGAVTGLGGTAGTLTGTVAGLGV